MKANILKGAILFCIIAFTVAIVPAQALAFTIHVENPYSQKLLVAFFHFDDPEQTWFCHGWENVPPKNSKNINISNSTGSDKVYIFAQNSETKFGGNGKAEAIKSIVVDDMFGYYDGKAAPNGTNRRPEYFLPFEIINGRVDYKP